MLPRKLRISKTEFKTLARGISYHSPTLSLLVHKRKDPTISQFAFICSKKVSKSAVKRKSLRRRGYNAVQKLLNNVKPGFFLVFNFKKGVEEVRAYNIGQEIEFLLKKSNLIN